MQKALIAAVVVVVAAVLAGAEEPTVFPYRKDYPSAQWITTEDLSHRQDMGTVTIIDVRSSIEYDVIHPVGSIHIPLSDTNFIGRLEELVKSSPSKALAFYCNGVTCLKSYEAAEKAVAAGLSDCYAYDAGIPEWAEVYPDKTLLLGKVLLEPETQLISDEEFDGRCLEFSDFVAKAEEPNVLVVDVRDLIQKSGKLPGLWNALSIPLDKFIPNFVQKQMHQAETLLIFDQVGKQVRWLEYYLVENGYKDYYFLKNGATEVLKKQEYK